MVNGLHLYSAFIQSALQFLPLIHPFTHTFTHQRRLAAMQGTNQLIRSNWGLGVLLRDTSTRPGWDRTGNPPTARRQLYLLSHIAPTCEYFFGNDTLQYPPRPQERRPNAARPWTRKPEIGVGSNPIRTVKHRRRASVVFCTDGVLGP